MKEKKSDYKFNPETIRYNLAVSRALTTAITISNLLLAEEIEPLHVFLALAQDNELLHNYFESHMIYTDTIDILNFIINEQELFEKITQKSYETFKKAMETDSEFMKKTFITDSEMCSISLDKNNLANTENTHKPRTEFIDLKNVSNESKNEATYDYDVEDIFEYSILSLPNISYSAELIDILNLTFIFCTSNGQNYINEDNLLYQIISSTECKKLLTFAKEFEFNLDEIKNYLSLSPTVFTSYKNMPLDEIEIPNSLKSCCTILNTSYQKTNCDILGRDKELQKLWLIFSKKTKKNCILVGNPGVGKTAIVEALVLSIINKTCPAKFKNYTVIELNITGMTAGTKYRGELEEKLIAFIKFVENTDNLIIFIDEIHNIIGTGSSTESAMDISGALKPILSRDSIVVVGATTTDEYAKFFNKEGALKRRFETITVKEPRLSQIKPMIKERIETLSKYHKVSISENILDYIIQMAFVFNSTTSNPDKTIDLLDKSLAYAHNLGSKKLLKKHIDSIFEENFNKYNNNSFEYNKSVAYHEAGHYIALMHYKKILMQNIILVSIIPDNINDGITCYEDMDSTSTNSNIEYFKARIAVDLAGRIAEKMYTNTISSGASADLVSANVLAEKIIAEYGMDSDYENIVLPYSINTKNNLLSEYALNEILKKKTALLNEIYKETETMLNSYSNTIEKIVKLLLKQKIVSGAELETIFINSQ